MFPLFFSRIYPIVFENARFLPEEIVIQGYRIPPKVSHFD